MTSLPLLSLVIWSPIVTGIVVLCAGRFSSNGLLHLLSLFGSLVSFCLTVFLWNEFELGTESMQFQELLPWISAYNINYHLGIDGISLVLLLLNTFVTVVVVISSWSVTTIRLSQYLASFLILGGMLNGVFCSLDAALFYVFFEGTLIPMFIIIGVWGGSNRVYAALKFFLYTLLGSLLALVALIYLYHVAQNSFSILVFHNQPLTLNAQILIFLAFFFAFAVKIPMWPVHTWLPDAHVEAPTAGSVVLAAVMLKLGGYGFLRLSLPILPDASQLMTPWIVGLSLIAIVYIGLVALVQNDMKKLIAYSSIAHMGFVTMGVFVLEVTAINGAIIQMVSHGFISAALFICIGILYDRMHSRNIADYGGVVNRMPVFASFFMLFAMANAGLPGTSGFVGEFLVIIGTMKINFWWGCLAATTLILGAAYTLWMYKRVIFGEIVNQEVSKLSDLDGREVIILSLLAIAVLFIGLYPKPFFSVLQTSVDHLLLHVSVSKL